MFKKISTIALIALLMGAMPAQAAWQNYLGKMKGHMSWGDMALLAGATASIFKTQLGATKDTVGSLAPDIAMFLAFNYRQSHPASLANTVKGFNSPTRGLNRPYVMDSMENAIGIMSTIVLANKIYNLATQTPATSGSGHGRSGGSAGSAGGGHKCSRC